MTCANCPHTPEICKPVRDWKFLEVMDGAICVLRVGSCPCCVKTVQQRIERLLKGIQA